ncbi:MFS transporter [uncultured Alsobacter sp.]|uniref:MFS transporter n=1 Tax=uncultured Alsobacter sp. TaxID=1748258 RepID=UPI0025FF0586|nr:MFS transporter [uncultured Alsobacter sp.]
MSDGLPQPQRSFAIATLLSAIALAVLDGAIANVALPTLSSVFSVSPAAAIWIVTAYQLALVMALLPLAALGESLGYRRVFTAGLMLFLAASAGCALAPSLGWLALGRFVQGFGGAAIMATTAALLRFTYPQRIYGMAIGWNAMVVGLSSAAGPTIGAGILSVASWPWLFAVNIPIGLMVLAGTRFLPEAGGTRRRLDVVSVLLNAGMFGSIVLGVDLLSSRALPALGLIAAGIACLVALVRREMPREAPLFPLDLLRLRPFRISVIASVSCFSAQMMSYVALPFYLMHDLGQDAFTTGLAMTPWPVTVALCGPLAGRLSNRVPTGVLSAIGGTTLATGLALAAAWPLAGGSILPLVPFLVLSGAGFGLFQTPNNRNMMLTAPRERAGAAGGMQSTARLAGQTIGALVMAVMFTVLADEIAPRVGLALAAVLALTAGVISTLRIAR